MYVYSLEVDMRFIIKYIIIFFVSLSFQQATSQAQNKKVENLTFTIRGLVRESDTYEPISKVNIEVNGGAYTMTDDDGTFRIKAKKGDELIVRHKDFETVYYTIKDDNRVTIEVEPNIPSSNQRLYKSRSDSKTFNSLVDSAATYLKKDAEKSIQFIADALETKWFC